jgi:putative transposase
MKKSRFTEEQIIGILREQEAGMKTAEVCRRHGISQPTFYAWKAKFGGMSVSDAKRLKQLEDENAKLKKLLAEAMLDNAVLKDITSRKLGETGHVIRKALHVVVEFVAIAFSPFIAAFRLAGCRANHRRKMISIHLAIIARLPGRLHYSVAGIQRTLPPA